jgi:translation elongation factor EF-Ts
MSCTPLFASLLTPLVPPPAQTGQQLVTALVTEQRDSTAQGPLATSAVLEQQWSGVTGREWIQSLVGVTKENCQLRRVTLMRATSTADSTQLLGSYVHSAFDNAASSAAELKQQHGASLELSAGQSAALVRVQVRGDVTKRLADLRALVRSLSTHIAGMKPRGISGSVPAASMSAVSSDEDAEPLYAQSYLFDDALTVQQLLQQRAKAWGLTEISVVDFAYWQCGEGIERKSESLRDEVAKLLN